MKRLIVVTGWVEQERRPPDDAAYCTEIVNWPSEAERVAGKLLKLVSNFLHSKLGDDYFLEFGCLSVPLTERQAKNWEVGALDLGVPHWMPYADHPLNISNGGGT